MKKGYLSEYFSGVGYKRLSAVEASRHRSNQHEFNGVNALRRILGTEPRTFFAKFIYLSDQDSEPITDLGYLTWYDSRAADPNRSAEYRLYFPDTAVSERANEGDLLIVGRRPDDSLLVIVTRAGSTYEHQVSWLFSLDGEGISGRRPGYAVKTEEDTDRLRMQFASRFILEQIGVDIELEETDHLEIMLKRFKGTFPPTRVFSDFARSTLPDLVPTDDPDGVLLAWMEREESLFRSLERKLISERLEEGFGGDVDSFISYSLSVQNRRKARAGSALENHLECLFASFRISYTRGGVTEGNSRPDFVFPSSAYYHDQTFPAEQLTILGVKSTCKDRWRQVLAEAERVENKHLLTLEPGISTNQTNEMAKHRLSLVLPRPIHTSYMDEQRKWLLDVKEFLTLVEDRQRFIMDA